MQTRWVLSGPKRLEGSRFVAWQLYGLVAGGSRERLDGWQFYGPLYPRRTEQRRWVKHRVGSFPGAACYQPIELPPYEAAPLQGVRSAQPVAGLQPFCTRVEFREAQNPNTQLLHYSASPTYSRTTTRTIPGRAGPTKRLTRARRLGRESILVAGRCKDDEVQTGLVAQVPSRRLYLSAG